MNHKYLLFGLLWFLFGCSDSNWTKSDKNNFLSDCIKTNQTQSMCHCVLNCIEVEFETYENATQQILNENVSIETEDCVNRCK